MLQSVIDNIFVKVNTKYISNMSDIMRLSAIQHNSSLDASDLVNIMGEVVSVPKIISSKIENKGYSLNNIQPGDIAIFSYLVISEVIPIPESVDVIFKNRIWYEGQELFAVNIKNLYGVIRDGEIIMLNGYTMVGEFVESKLVIPHHLRRLNKAAKSELMHIGEPKEDEPYLSANGGDSVYINPFSATKYQIGGKKFCIVTQNKILGKKIF